MTARAKRPARAPETGRFESASPLNDPAILEQTVRWVRAITELEPLVKHMQASFANGGTPEDVRASAGMLAVDMTLAGLKASLLEALSVEPAEKRRALSPEVSALRVLQPQAAELARLRRLIAHMGGADLP